MRSMDAGLKVENEPMPFKVKMLLFFMGVCVCSPWSSIITMQILHLPLSFPELLFVCFAPFIYRYFDFDNPFKRKVFWVLLLVWMLLLCIGLMQYNAFAVLSTSRTYLYIIFFYSMFSQKNATNLHVVYYILYGALVGWLFASIYSFLFIEIDSEEERSVVYGPMIAIPIILVYTLHNQKYKRFFLLTIICIVIGIFSGLRRELAVLVATILFGFVFFYTYSYSKYKSIGRYLIILALIVSASYPFVSAYLEQEAFLIYVRVFMKTESIFTGEGNKGDDQRIELLKECYEDIDENIIPKGFLNKQYGTESEEVNGFINDVPMLELIAMLGFFVAYLLVFYFAWATYRGYLKVWKRDIPSENICFVASGAVMLMLLFLEGSFLTFPYIAPITGFCIGKIQSISGLRWNPSCSIENLDNQNV